MYKYGKSIREARKKADLTQKELAEVSGVAKITIQQYEAGKRQPRLEQLRLLADAMRISMGELLGEESVEFKEVIHENWFMNYLGLRLFSRTEGNYNTKYVLYDCNKQKAFYINAVELKRMKENIITFVKFQIFELLKDKESVDLKDMRENDIEDIREI